MLFAFPFQHLVLLQKRMFKCMMMLNKQTPYHATWIYQCQITYELARQVAIAMRSVMLCSMCSIFISIERLDGLEVAENN